MVYPANAFNSRLRDDYLGTAWFKSDKISKKDFGLASRNRLSLSLPLSFSPSSSFLSQYKKQKGTKLGPIPKFLSRSSKAFRSFLRINFSWSS